jgi:phasin family protein
MQNPFLNNPMFAQFQQAFSNNPMADAMKSFGQFKTPTFDVTQMANQAANLGRKNMETVSNVAQTVAENAQTITRRQAELARAHVEKMLKTSKDMLVNGSPEINTSKQAEYARGLMESSLNNLREVSELFTKSGFEVFDALNRQATANLEEVTKATKKKAA